MGGAFWSHHARRHATPSLSALLHPAISSAAGELRLARLETIRIQIPRCGDWRKRVGGHCLAIFAPLAGVA